MTLEPSLLSFQILDVTLHLQAVWKDTRLSFNATSPNNNYTLAKPIQNKIWTPATYMEPEWGSQNADTRVIRVFPNGVLAESKRYKIHSLSILVRIC